MTEVTKSLCPSNVDTMHPSPVSAFHPTQLVMLVMRTRGGVHAIGREHDRADSISAFRTSLHPLIALSLDPETTRLPSGDNERDITQSVCPSNGPDIMFPVSASHTPIVLSLDAETIRLPSGENAMEVTGLVCSPNSPDTTFPVSASHTLIVLSKDAERMRLPSGEPRERKGGDGISMPYKWARHDISSLCIPNSNCHIGRPRDNELAVG